MSAFEAETRSAKKESTAVPNHGGAEGVLFASGTRPARALIDSKGSYSGNIVSAEVPVEKQDHFQLLVEKSPEAIYVVQNGLIQFANPMACRLAGCSDSAELTGRPFLDFVPLKDQDDAKAHHNRLMCGEMERSQKEYRIVKPDGRTAWLLVNAVRIAWNGQPATLNYASDITERKIAEAEHQRRQSQLSEDVRMESVGRLAGGIAHDFNNMSQVILGNLDLAMQDLSQEHPLLAFLTEIQNSAHRSVDLTRQLLAYAGKQFATPRIVDLNKVVEDSLGVLRRMAGKTTDLSWLPGRDIWSVKADPAQVEQVLTVLCENARDAMEGRGKIQVETRNITVTEENWSGDKKIPEGSYVALMVKDTGCGMDGSVIPHLFEPFFTTKEVGRGSGLGLASVFGIIKQNKGYITVRSEPGKGSVFCIYWPRFESRIF